MSRTARKRETPEQAQRRMEAGWERERIASKTNVKANPRLSELLQVTLHFWRHDPKLRHDVTEAGLPRLILASELDRYVEASKRLHFQPGRNPHNNGKTKTIYRIEVSHLGLRGPFWWSTPDLQNNYDLAGARMIDAVTWRDVWRDEVVLARWRAEEEREEFESEHDEGAAK